VHERRTAGQRRPAPPRVRPKRTFPAEVLSPDEVRALLDACSTRWTGVRNRAMLAVLYRAGLRITEALSLHPKDLDAAAGTVRVLHGKGNRSRTVGMDAGGFEMVASWMTARATLGIEPFRGPLLCLRDGSPIASSYIRVMLPRLARKARIEKRVHAHGLRHTHAAELRAEGVEVGIISKQLGHSNIATTAIYLDHIQPLRVVETVRARAWPSPAPAAATTAGHRRARSAGLARSRAPRV